MTKKLLNKIHKGFRPKHSVELPILHITNDSLKILAAQESCLIFFRSASSVRHHQLYILANHPISQNVYCQVHPECIQSDLRTRIHFEILVSFKSSTYTVNCSGPPGSGLRVTNRNSKRRERINIQIF